MTAATARTVLVTDGEHRAALAIVRSLGRAGHRVYVGSASPSPLAGASRFARGTLLLPDPMREPDGYAEAVGAAARQVGADTIFPVTDAALLSLLPARDARLFGLGDLRIPFPSDAIFRKAGDKRFVIDEARRLGISVPDQQVLVGPGDLPSQPLTYPVVIKPARSVGVDPGIRKSFTIRYAEDEQELASVLSEYGADGYPLLLQQRIVGPGCGIFLLLWDDEVRALFAHRRLREKPPSGGVSVYSESVAPDPALVAQSRALLSALEWSGVAMIEYKIDAKTDTPYLMEINGRFWGSLQLAIDAGVDFPTLLLAAAHGENGTAPPVYREGVRLRWWWGDIDHLLARFRASADASALAPETPGRARLARDVLTPRLGHDAYGEVFRWSDPRPFVRESLAWLRSAFRSR
ncbi:MAG: ATP-grasp domain-containing protein [Gemmatimonadota bacterium]|nr:ATP-grasp domain-containing protein [Gemmatimonadota bacterium]